MSRKLVSAALAATTLMWAVGVAALPVANAQSSASLQAQIQQLLAQISQLQAQMGTSSTQTMTTASYSFNSDLTVGSKGADVTALQQFLINKGYLTAVSSPTGYFGTLTQKALAAYQSANGISPAVGYFGPKTRAFLNSMSVSSGTTTTTTTSTSGLPAGCTSTSGYSPTTGQSCSSTMTTTTTGTQTTVVAPATGIAVSLAASNPATGSLISSASAGSARVPVMAVNFTAGSAGAVTLSGVNFQKTGVLSDSAISGAYLTENGQVVAQYNSLNSGLLSFSGMGLSIPAGQTLTLTLAIDVSQGLNAGNTTGFSLPSASDVTAWDSSNNAITATGSFPLNGNTFTVTTVNNPSLASVTMASTSIGTTVTAGTQGNIVAAWNFTVNNSPVWLQNLNFHVIGSANVANIQNVKLLVNGTQVGQTLASVPASAMADFNASASPAKLNTGSNNVQVVADIMGSPSDYFQFEILNGYDVLAVDSQYNVPVTVTNSGNGNGGIGTQVAIQTGQITVNQDPNTPTGNIARGQSGVVLAKYDIYAAGEPVKVKYLDFNMQLQGATEALSSEIQNVTITDDAGNQVGTSINQPPTGYSCADGTSAYTTSTSPATYTDCFGSSGSPINYIVPANTTRVLSLKADVQTTADFTAITANLTGDSGNLQGMTSSQSGSTSGINGVTLTLVSSSLNVTQNNALGTQNVSAGTTNLTIGSFAFSASSAEGVNVNTVTIQLTPGMTTSEFQNLKLMVNGTQFGQSQGVVSGEGSYSFSGTAFSVPAGQTINVSVMADSMSNATGTLSPATEVTGYSGTGAVSYTSVNFSGSDIVGQTVSFNGQPALTISQDSSNPPASQIVQNSSGDYLAAFRFSETSNVESVKVTQLNVLDKVASSSVKAGFSQVGLYQGTTLLGTAQSPVLDASGTAYIYVFNSFSSPLVVPQGSSVALTLEGMAGSVQNGSLSDDTTSTFAIATTTDNGVLLTYGGTAVTPQNNSTAVTVVARGNTSNKTAAVTLSNASGNPQTTLRTVLGVSATPVTGVPPASFQQIGSITFTANAAGDAAPQSLVLTTNSTNTAMLTSTDFVLHDPSGNDIVAVSHLATSSYNAAAGTATWNFATSTGASAAPLVVTAGTSYTLTLWANLADIPAIAQTSQSLTVSIKTAATDFTYNDGTNAVNGIAPSTITLLPQQVPVTVANLTTPVGGQF